MNVKWFMTVVCGAAFRLEQLLESRLQRDGGAGDRGHVRCWRDGVHEDPRAIDNRFTFKPCIRDCKSIYLVSFTFLNTVVTFQLPSNLSGRGTGEVLKCKEKISLSDCQVTTSSSLSAGTRACRCSGVSVPARGLSNGTLLSACFVLPMFDLDSSNT